MCHHPQILGHFSKLAVETYQQMSQNVCKDGCNKSYLVHNYKLKAWLQTGVLWCCAGAQNEHIALVFSA